MQFIDLAAQLQSIRPEIDRRIQGVLAHGKYIQGPEVRELEMALADYVGVKHCVSTSSGTDGLLVALMALDVGPGDEVICPAFAYAAPVEMALLLGAKPVFVDIDGRSFNLDPEQLDAAVSSKTKAIIPVSLYGQCADMKNIGVVAGKHNIPVIEDAAQSFGATSNGAKSCALSELAVTSFFPTKPLGAYGDAGAIFTDDDSLADAMKEICLHGQNGKYNHIRLGLNARLDTMQAAVLLAKLTIFESELSERSRIAARYNKELKQAVPGIGIPNILPGNDSVYAQYTITIDNRDEIAAEMSEIGVPCFIHYPKPLYKQSAFLDQSINLPESEEAAKRVLSLPMGPHLSQSDQDRVIKSLSEVINNASSDC